MNLAKSNKYIPTNTIHSKPQFRIGPVTDDIFSSEFLQSLDRAERDVAAGRIKKLKSLKDLRK